ncbi:MAG: amino acid ABC transporter permease, partial [Actinobacteria bacterium]|nr:amino acid ABC transporter permease [Actinomycetota bacterium]
KIVRVTRTKVLSQLMIVYVDLFRGTPLLMQIIFVYYALPYLGINLPAPVAGIVALSLNSGAYVSEIFRAGIESIERGQMEAARSLGMSYAQAMRYIIIPQTIKRVLPPLTNEFVALIKDSSLLSVIAISELLRTAREMMTWKLNPSSLTAAALIYLIITLPLTRLVNRMEQKLKRGES